MERQIEVHAPIASGLRAVRTVLRADPGALFAPPDTTRSAESRTVSSSIAVTVGDGATVHHAIAVTIGRHVEEDDAIVLPVRWDPVGHDRLLPSFEGEIVIVRATDERTIALRGAYTAPLGPVGRFGDQLVGHRVARQSLQSMIEEIAERLDREVTRRWTRDVMTARAPAYNADLREYMGIA